jgi:hypothetical protein
LDLTLPFAHLSVEKASLTLKKGFLLENVTFANLYTVQNPIKVGKPQRSDGFKPPDMPKESRFW